MRVSLVTLGVADLARARAFYEALGFRTGAGPEDDVVFFDTGGLIVSLWSRRVAWRRTRACRTAVAGAV